MNTNKTTLTIDMEDDEFLKIMYDSSDSDLEFIDISNKIVYNGDKVNVNKNEEEYLKIDFDDDEEEEEDCSDNDNNKIEEEKQHEPEPVIEIKSPAKFISIKRRMFMNSPHRRIVRSYKRRAQTISAKASLTNLMKNVLSIQESPEVEEIEMSSVNADKNGLQNPTSIEIHKNLGSDENSNTNGTKSHDNSRKDSEELFECVVENEIDDVEEHDVRFISDDSLSGIELEEEIDEFPMVEDPTPIKYSIPQNLLSNEQDKLADNQKSGREIYEKLMGKNRKGLVTKTDNQERPVPMKSTSRRKTLHVPKIDLDESSLYANNDNLKTIPKRPADNIELIECLSTYRILTKKLLEKIKIPEMDIMSNTDDLINVYKLLRN